MFSRFTVTPKSDIPDVVAQFANQKRFLARKSSSPSQSSEPGAFPVAVELDDARVYFPGQLVRAKVTLPADADAGGDVVCEYKAWTHAYGWVSNGSGTYPIFEKDVHFSVEGSIPPPPSSSAGTGLTISKDDSGGPNTWIVSTRLPTSIAVKSSWRSVEQTSAVPPTCKTVKKGSLHNSVFWTFKLTLKRSGNLKRNLRVWKPFLVLPLAPQLPPVPNLPMLVVSPEGIPPTPKSIATQLPSSWQTFSFQSKIKSNLVFSKATVSIHLFLPKTENVRPGPVPVLLHVAVSAKKESDLLSAGSVRLPDLPLSDSPNAGFENWAEANSSSVGQSKAKDKDKEDSSEQYQPTFEITRYTRSRAHGADNRARHRIPAFVQWDAPAFLSAAHSKQVEQNMDHGYAWTEPMPTEKAGLIATADEDDDQSSLPLFTRSALLTGRLLINVPPPIDSYNLRIKYKLRFRWAQPGMGNTIAAKLGRWIASSGVDAAELARLGGERPAVGKEEDQSEVWRELDRRVLGPRYALLASGQAGLDDDDEDDDDDGKDDKFDDDDDDDGGDSKKTGFFSKFRSNRHSATAGADDKSGAQRGEHDDSDDSDDSDDVAHLKAKMAAADLAEGRRKD
ncbi:hypothetical protein OC835_005774 [Tilletia horrida]|nr:hypothetical protein OC835_005774 [Tilletia horrida]